jgi:hypothetical protein
MNDHMVVYVTTKSGAQYVFDKDELMWERIHGTVDIHGLPATRGRTIGHLVEWPAIIAGASIMFDDFEVGVIYTTPVVGVKVVYES